MSEKPNTTKRADDQPALIPYPKYRGALRDQPEAVVRAQLLECLDYFGIGATALPGLPSGCDSPSLDAWIVMDAAVSYVRAMADYKWRDEASMLSRVDDVLAMRRADIADAVHKGVKAQLAAMAAEEAGLYDERVALARWVYFIASDDGPIKIGVAINPQSRLKGLQTSHPSQLRILALTTGGTQQESAYHRQFGAHRLTGEWFNPAPEIIAEIERLAPTA